MAGSRTIPRESMFADSTAAGSRSVSLRRVTSSTKPAKRPIAVSMTPSPPIPRTEVQVAATLPADLGAAGISPRDALRAQLKQNRPEKPSKL